MSQLTRLAKNLEPPRPLKSTIKQPLVNPMYEVHTVDELITLTENVAGTLNAGSNNADNMSMLTYNLRIHGPQLEQISKDTLDRAFVIFRNASQDERLSIMTRLNLLELIELRAKGWQVSDDINLYYQQAKANKIEADTIQNDVVLLSTSPPGTMSTGAICTTSTPVLGPGEVIRNSGKFSKPTKIPGKNYSKDEVVIRNADSGKVNPGAKERLVQITGPNEEKINYAKHLIEDTIRRNASPVRLEPSQEDDSSLASSSISDEPSTQRVNTNRNSIGGIIQQPTNMVSQMYVPNQVIGPVSAPPAANKYRHSTGGQNNLLHSYSTNDASLGEYKYTVNVGQHSIKITGDCFDLVRVAKLVLDDYFSSSEFLASVEAEEALNHTKIAHGGMHNIYNIKSTHLNPLAIPVIPISQQFINNSMSVDRIDSGIALDKISKTASGVNIKNENEITEGEDDVFIVDDNGQEIPVGSSANSSSSTSSSIVTVKNNVNVSGGTGLCRSKRSNFANTSRHSASPDNNQNDTKLMNKELKKERIFYKIDELLEFSKSPFAWSLPIDWIKICEKLPSLVRNKVKSCENNNDPRSRSNCFRQKSLDLHNSKVSAIEYVLKQENNNHSLINTEKRPFLARSTSLCD